MLLADALDEPEPETDAPADRALGRPALPRRGRRDDTGRRADRRRVGTDAGILGQRLAGVGVV